MARDSQTIGFGRTVTFRVSGIRVTTREVTIRTLRDDRTTTVALIGGHNSGRLTREDRAMHLDVLEQVMDEFDAVAAPATREWLDPTLHHLGPWRPPGWMASATHLSELDHSEISEGGAPTILGSRGTAWVDGVTLTARPVTSPPIDPNRPHRMVLEDDRHIIKAEIASLDYCERSEVNAEASFIREHRHFGSRLGLPALTATASGRAVQTLVRERIPGATLAELGDAGRTGPIAQALVRKLSQWSQMGLHHNDLRPWNVLWDGQQVNFIDYSDSDDYAHDASGLPETVAVAALLAWIRGGALPLDDTYADVARAMTYRALRTPTALDRPDRWNVTPLVLDRWERILADPGGCSPDQVFAMASHTEGM